MLQSRTPTRFSKKCFAACGVTSLAMTGLSVMAIEAKAETTLQPSREIVVTATRAERELFDVPSTVSVVDAKQMERESKGTIAQQLQDIPGIMVSDGGIGGGSKRVTIRGEGGARVLILIDGMKISEQKSMDGSMIMIDPNNVERIEVIKGPSSVLYGSEAIGGVVNIITKKGGNKPVQGSLAFTWDGSNESLTPYVSLYGRHEGFSYRFSGDYIDAGDKTGGSGRIRNSGYRQRNFSAYMDYSWDKGKAGFGYDHYWSKSKIPGVVTTAASASSMPLIGTVNGISTTRIDLELPRWERDRLHAFVELEDLSNTLRKVRFSPFVQKTRKDFTNEISARFTGEGMFAGAPAVGETDVSQNPVTINKQATYGANLQTDWTFGASHYVIAGVDYLYDDLDARTENEGYVRISVTRPNGAVIWQLPGVNVVTSSSNFYKGSQQTVAAYVQDEWSLHPDWTVTTGFRGTWVWSELSDTDDRRALNSSDSDSNVVGSLGVVYAGFRDWRLRALYSSGYRYPLLNQLYIGTSHGGSGYTYGNPELKPETSHNVEIGARYEAHGLRGDFSMFYTRAADYITTSRLPSVDGIAYYMFDNVNAARTFGAEFTLAYLYQPYHLTPYVSGTYIRRAFDSGGKLGETYDTGLPNQYGRVGLKFERPIAPQVDFYADAYARIAARTKERVSDGTTEKLHGWGTANLAAGARFGKNREYSVDINLNNIFDKSYVPAMSSLEDPGFHAVLRFGANF